ncbi:MAG: glycoside hydrolase family 18 protein, partial [Parcubacteria group bacterium]|nr:glycoside hydrolase family 18 protein [Parcubacteria group bacterium]
MPYLLALILLLLSVFVPGSSVPRNDTSHPSYFYIDMPRGGQTQSDAEVVARMNKNAVIIDAFLIPENDGRMRPSPNLQNRLNNGFVQRVKGNGNQVLLVVGGASDGGEPLYPRFGLITSDSTAYQRFLNETLLFIEQNGYDGVLVNWESPQTAAERDALTKLMADLRSRLPQGAIIGADITPGYELASFNLPALNQYVDLFFYQSYGFGPIPGSEAGLQGPLGPFASVDAAGKPNLWWPREFKEPIEYSTRGSARYLVEQGVPPEKLVITLPNFSLDFRDPARPYFSFFEMQKKARAKLLRRLRPAKIDPHSLEALIDGISVTTTESVAAKKAAFQKEFGPQIRFALWEIGHEGPLTRAAFRHLAE